MISRNFRLAGMVLLASAAPAQAANDTIAIAPAPGWAALSPPTPAPADAKGVLFFERQDTHVHLDATGQSHFQAYRVKLLHPQALGLGNVAVAWNPAAGPATVHTVAIHRGGEVVNVLDKAKFEILRREDQLEQSMLSGVLTAVLHVPDLRVGDVLDVAFTLRDADPTLGGTVAGLWSLAEVPVPGRYRMALSWEPGQEPRTRISPALTPAVSRDADSLAIALSDPPPLAAPKDAPPRFGWQRVAEYSDFADWGAVAAKFAPLYAEAARLAPGSPLKAEAARIRAAHPHEMERAAAALKLVQQQVRYVYVGMNGGNLTPASADTSWQRRYADCKGKTALLLALLSELGIRAEPVLVNNSGTDDGLDQRLPNPGFFDHVLVRATIAGKVRWLDATLPPVARPSLRPIVPYRWVLPVMAKEAQLEQIAWKPYLEPQEINLYEIDAREGFDSPATITSTTIVRGIKGLAQYATMSALTPDQIATSLRNELTGDQFTTVEAVRWRYDEDNDASILTISGKGPVEWDDDGDGAKSLSLPGGGFSPPNRRLRDAGQDQAAPYDSEGDYSCSVTTVRLPASTNDLEWSFNTTFANTMYGRVYYRAMRRQDGTIRMIRGSMTGLDEVPASLAMRDNERLADFDNSRANIYFTPGRKNVLDPADFPAVPATWEIDWARPSPPCMPNPEMLEAWKRSGHKYRSATVAATPGPSPSDPEE